MRSFRFIDQKAGRVIASLGLLLATILPTLTPALAAAAQITSRSIELSNSTASATGVTYQINFTSVGAAEAVLVDFCSDTPLIGEVCTAPTGFTVASVTESDADITSVVAEDANTLFIEGSVAAATAKSFEVNAITNPSTVGPMYARIVTYATDLTNAQAQYTDATSLGTYVDTGSVAVSITDGIGVSGDVLETLTFCASATAVTGTGCSAGVSAPTLALGETTGSVTALSALAVSTGDIWTQLSTNASGGAVVSLKSGNACGGLKRVEAVGCDIAPAMQTGISASQAKVGVLAAPYTAQDLTLSATGTYQVVPASGYNGSTFVLNFNGTTDGVASPYGDPIFNTNNTQTSNKATQLTFGASISNTTPAGSYSNSYSLIATGTF